MSVNRKYTIGRPSQDVRLRNWPAGKVAQLKTAIQTLEDQLNTAMATQIAQGDKRVFNSRVPKVTNIVVSAGFKNFQLHFDEAKGIDDLLFYEIQKDSSASFPTPTTSFTTQTSLTIPTTTEREEVHFRIRVVNSKFDFGPWSSTASATGSSDFRITVTRKASATVNIPWADVDTWTDISGITYTPTNASVCLNIHAGVNSPVNHPTTTPHHSAANTNYVLFRILRNGVALSSTFAVGSTGVAAGGAGEGGDDLTVYQVTSIATMVTPIEAFIGNETPVTYALQAYLDSGASSRITTGGTQDNSDAEIVVDAFDIIELVEAVNGDA